MDKKTTILDVAELSGYSITTVSRVMNGNYPVKEATRKKIQEVIDELNFSPNMLARGLIGANTNSIGIIVPSIENLFFSEVIRGIDDVLRQNDYTAFICSTNDDIATEKKHISNLVDRKVDGIISISPDTRLLGKDYERLSDSLPVILINGEQEGYDCYFLSSDQATGTRKALAYLTQEGHSSIAFLRGHDSYSYNLKENIYRSFMSGQGGIIQEDCIVRLKAGNTLVTVEESKEAMIEVLTRRKDITAVFACNDLMAVGVLNAAKELGLDVPSKLRIIGFDNTMTCLITNPTLSSVDQNMSLLGETAARKLLTLIEGKDLKGQKKSIIETSLVIRNT